MKRANRSIRLSTISVLIVSLFSISPSPGGLAVSRAGMSAPPARQSRTLPLPVSGSRAFINYRDNETVGCRDATEEEATALKRRADRRLHVISPDHSNRTQTLSAQSTGLQIVLRATDQLEDYPTARAAFLNAAALWESLIASPTTVVIDVDFGPTWFGESYDDNVLGQTDAQVLGDSSIYGQVRDSLIGLAINDERSSVFNQLPASALPTDIGSTSYVLAPSAVWRALGFINAAADPVAEEEDLGDPPAVGFNSQFDYDFDPSNGVDPDKIDFDSVAVHEIGHILGFASNTGYRELVRNSPVAVSVWDIFRLRPGATLDTFATAQRILSSGGNQDFFDGSREVALSTGRPDGTGGDRQQASHWKDDRATGQYIGVMDPTISDGQRDVVTENDLAALRSFGYAVNAGGIDPDAPSITKVTFNGKKLKLTGAGFDGLVTVEINGQAVDSAIELKINGSGKKLQIKANQSELNIQSGSNLVQVLSNGVRSNTFAFTL